MEVLDDEGRLLGYVNLIDALVVLLLLAVLVTAGVYLTGGEQKQPATRYATIELGSQPEYVAEAISEGDVATAADTNSELRLTDVYVTPANDGGYFVTVNARLQGEIQGSPGSDREAFVFGGSVLRNGQKIRFETPGYSVSGVVRDVSRNTSEISLETVTAVVELRNVDPSVANALSTGMTERVGGRTTAQVTDVQVEPSMVVVESDAGELFLREHPRNKDVRMELELLTRRTKSGRWFHGSRLRINTDVNLDLERITVSGRVTEIR